MGNQRHSKYFVGDTSYICGGGARVFAARGKGPGRPPTGNIRLFSALSKLKTNINLLKNSKFSPPQMLPLQSATRVGPLPAATVYLCF